MSSKSLSAGQARTYHAREFASERQNYWSRDQQGFSEWQGRLAEQWGLSGSVGNDQFARLSEGQHPFAAHRTRDRKELLSPEEVQRQHRELAGQYGHQADRVVAEMRERTQKLTQENSPAQTRTPEQTARQAVTYARDHLFEKEAVQDRRAIYETALNRGMGEITYSQVRQEFEQRMQAGEFREAQASVRGPQITTAQMVRMEREIVGQMQQGNRRG